MSEQETEVKEPSRVEVSEEHGTTVIDVYSDGKRTAGLRIDHRSNKGNIYLWSKNLIYVSTAVYPMTVKKEKTPASITLIPKEK